LLRCVAQIHVEANRQQYLQQTCRQAL
jgi:hypothetical protein